MFFEIYTQTPMDNKLPRSLERGYYVLCKGFSQNSVYWFG